MVRILKTAAPAPPSSQISTEPSSVIKKHSKKTTKTSLPIASESVVETTTTEPVVAPEVVVEPPAVVPNNEVVPPLPTTENPQGTLTTKFVEFGVKLQQAIALLHALKTEYKALSKVVEKNQRLAKKKNSLKKKSTESRKPSGFVKPTRITNELAAFLGINHGTLLARTQVSSEINKYIHAHNLQDKTNGRKIIPDEKLKKLLNLTPEDELTYFNLQKYMKHHFIKDEKPVTSNA